MDADVAAVCLCARGKRTSSRAEWGERGDIARRSRVSSQSKRTYGPAGSSAKAAERDLTDWQKSSRITGERAASSCNSKTRVSHMPLAVATESSHLPPSRFLSFSPPSYPHNLFPSVCTHMCLSASLFSVSSTLYLLLRPLSSFPSSRPPCEPTERRFNPSPIVKINGFPRSFLYAHVSASISEESRVNAPRCNALRGHPSISVLMKTGVCVFDPCWAMTLVDTRFVYLSCVRTIWPYLDPDFS